MRYRSAVVHGVAEEVPSADKDAALPCCPSTSSPAGPRRCEPARARSWPPPRCSASPWSRASVKVAAGPPEVDPEDEEPVDVWAGILPAPDRLVRAAGLPRRTGGHARAGVRTPRRLPAPMSFRRVTGRMTNHRTQEELDMSEQSTPVETGYAPVNGLQMYYEIHGSGDGTPLLLLHGGLFNIDLQFGHVLPGARRRAGGWSPPTSRGTAAPTTSTGRSRRADLASDVVGLLQHLGLGPGRRVRLQPRRRGRAAPGRAAPGPGAQAGRRLDLLQRRGHPPGERRRGRPR